MQVTVPESESGDPKWLEGFHMVKHRLGAYYTGQQVKVIACGQDLPEHTGQIGILRARPSKNSAFSVHLDSGICQAAKVEALNSRTPVNTPSEETKRRRRIAWMKYNFI